MAGHRTADTPAAGGRRTGGHPGGRRTGGHPGGWRTGGRYTTDGHTFLRYGGKEDTEGALTERQGGCQQSPSVRIMALLG
jgi:hypothetical protein